MYISEDYIPNRYIIGRTNLAVTIFVPYDCPNHCPFCNSKKEYKNKENFSMEKIIESVNNVVYHNGVKDIVITGGEPFADLEQLQILLDTLKPAVLGYHKNLFINTTLPIDAEDEEKVLEFIYKNDSLIKGLNISRHIGFKTNNENNNLVKKLSRSRLKIRINSVLYKDEYSVEEINNFINEYTPICDQISFRADYRKIKTQDDLREIENNSFVSKLFNMRNLFYLSSGGCMVCNNDDFITKDNKIISYHRGMENSLIKKGCYTIINDIVIKQDGKIVIDWDKEELNLDLFQ